MSSLDEAAALARREAIVGTGPGGAAKLPTLAWLAARDRFARPPAPAFVEAAVWPDDPRALVPAGARSRLVALLTGKEARAGGPYACRIAAELQHRRLRLHPFDLKAMEEFVARQAGRLGAQAQAWLAIVRPAQAETQEIEYDVPLTADTFAAAGRAAKLAFVRTMRAGDAAAARAFVAERMASEGAIVRAGFVGVLDIGLGPDDAELLATFTEDRAASVRDAATALLARVPGSEAYEARRRDAAHWLEAKSSGLIRKTVTIKVKRPANLPDGRWEPMLAAAFEGVTLADMAQPFGLTVEAFVRACLGEWALLRLVAARAVREDRPDLLAVLSEGDEALDPDTMLDILHATLPALAAPRRAAMLEAALHPLRWSGLPPRHRLEPLLEAAGGPLPEPIAAALLHSAAWRATLDKWRADEDRGAADTLEVVAALMPPAQAPAFLAAIADLPLHLGRRPRLFFDSLAALAAAPGADP